MASKQNKVLAGILATTLAVATGVVVLTTGTTSLQKIDLPNEDAYVNQHAKDDLNKLTDGDIKTRFTQWNPRVSPYTITYPFYDYDTVGIKQIRFRYNNGNPSTLKFYIVRKSDNQKILLGGWAGGSWDSLWKTIDIPNPVAARSFIIESKGNDDFPDDIELLGYYSKGPPAKSTHVPSPTSDLLGVVVKPWDVAGDYMFPEKIPSLQGLGINRVRLYNDYILNHDAAGNLIENSYPWHQATNMALLKSKGITTQMCYLSLPSTYPWPPTGSLTDPSTYIKLAKDVYQFGVWNKAGGEYSKTFELLNEDGAWYNPSYQFDGYQLAAMYSICYDGHKGKFPGVGLKASGSKAEFSIGGLAEAEPYLLYQMMEWSIANRGYRADGTPDLPFDIYSFHCYSSLEGQRAGIPGGIAPEYGSSPYFKKIAKVRDTYFPWLKIHVGEWGWDLNAGSMMNAPAFANYSAAQTSGNWSIRNLLWMAIYGMDACSYYRVKQDYDAADDNNSTLFATMALLRQWGTGTKQPDGSYIGLDMRRTLTGDYFRQFSIFYNGGFAFDSLLSTSPFVARFKKGDSLMYAIWSKENMTVTTRPQFTESTGTYTLNVKGKIRRLVDDGSGVMSSEDFAGGNIAYGSKPVFVVTGGGAVVDPTPIPVPDPVPVINYKQVDKGYFKDPDTQKNQYWIINKSSDGKLVVVKTNSKYVPQ